MTAVIDAIHGITRPGHIMFGIVGLAAFWVPILVAKGGRTHVAAGKAYTFLNYVVLGTAAAGVGAYLLRERDAPTTSAQYAIMLALGFLTIVALALILQGRGAVTARGTPRVLRTLRYLGVHALTFAGGLGLVAYAFVAAPPNRGILIAVALLGLLAAYEGVAYASKALAEPREWLYQHLNGMIGSGVAFYTAFAVFGAQRLFGFSAGGSAWTSILPWLLPAAIALPATFWWKRRLMRGVPACRPAAGSRPA